MLVMCSVQQKCKYTRYNMSACVEVKLYTERKRELNKEGSREEKGFLSGHVVMGMLVITEWAWCLETQHTALPTHTCKIPWAWSVQRPNSSRHSYKHKHMCIHTHTWNQHYWKITFSQCICKHTTGLNCLNVDEYIPRKKKSLYAMKGKIAFLKVCM